MRYVIRDGELVPKHLAEPVNAPYIRTDGMEPTRNMADGKMYDSRSAYERAVKAAGCEIIGNDQNSPSRGHEPRGVERDIARAIEQLR